MANLSHTKESVYQHIMLLIENKIDAARLNIQSAKESRDNETKSSVGDKYETGRAMMQIELEKNRVQLNKALNLKNELEQIDPNTKTQRIGFGSMVITNIGSYFISIGIGKLRIEKESIFCISLASPIGKFLHNKKVGDKFVFQGKEIIILEIL